QQVAHRAADDVRLVAGFLERVDDVGGPLVDQRRVDAVLLGADFAPLAEIRTRRFTAAKQLVDESFDHGSEKRSSMRQPRCVAMGTTTNSLVAVTMATRSPARWWLRTNSRACSWMTGTMTSRMNCSCARAPSSAPRRRTASVAKRT